jgi:hypothetical protein
MIWAVAWELLLVAAGLTLARRLVDRAGEQWLGALAFALMADGLMGTWLTWAGWNHALSYALPAAALCVPAWKGIRAGWSWGEWQVWPVPVALLFLALRPVGEVDSLFNLHFVLGWLENRTTPLDYAFNYAGFWEAGLLPVLTLGQSDLVMWLRPAEGLLAVGLGVWVIGEELGVERRLRGAAVAASIAFMHFWWGQSGVATVKNDLLVSAGQVMGALVVLRVMRGAAGRWEGVLAGMAAVFVSTKSSGPFLVGAAALGWIVWRRRVEWRWAAGMGGVWMAGVGYVYAANLARFGNPFYPFTLKIGPVLLPGRADQSGTSIWANLGDERLWRLFLWPEGGVSPAGVLFPAFLIAAPLVLWRVNRGLLVYMTAIAALYLKGIYSAGGVPGSLRFVEADLSTLRYMGGALAVGEMAVVASLGRWGWVFAAVQGVSRLWLMAGRESRAAGLEALALAAAVCAAAWALRRWPGVAVAAAVAAGCWQVERKRAGWLPEMREVWQVVHEAPAAKVSLLVEDDYSPQPCAHWWVMGRGLRHAVSIGFEPGARYVVWPRLPEGAKATWSREGYRVRAEAREAVLWEREAPTNSRTEGRR